MMLPSGCSRLARMLLKVSPTARKPRRRISACSVSSESHPKEPPIVLFPHSGQVVAAAHQLYMVGAAQAQLPGGIGLHQQAVIVLVAPHPKLLHHPAGKRLTQRTAGMHSSHSAFSACRAGSLRASSSCESTSRHISGKFCTHTRPASCSSVW